MTSKIGFSAEYVENLSPAERDMYIRYYIKEKEEEAKKQKAAKGGSGPTIGGPTGE